MDFQAVLQMKNNQEFYLFLIYLIIKKNFFLGVILNNQRISESMFSVWIA